jgi:hypothetical protein
MTDKASEYFEAYSFLKNYNLLPDDGGISNQPSKFLKAIKVCDVADSLYKKLEEENKAKVLAMKERAKNGKTGKLSNSRT